MNGDEFVPQGLKPAFLLGLGGTAEAVASPKPLMQGKSRFLDLATRPSVADDPASFEMTSWNSNAVS